MINLVMRHSAWAVLSIGMLSMLWLVTSTPTDSDVSIPNDAFHTLWVADWPTNGGNLYNQRYAPLTQIHRDNVSALKGGLNGLKHEPRA